MTRQELKGVSVSPGVGIGAAFVVVRSGHEAIARRVLPASQVAEAMERFETARIRAIEALQRVQSATAREFGIQDAAIYGAQVAVLKDPDALRLIRRLMRDERLAPEFAIQQLINKFEKLFDGLEGGAMKNWAADLRDPWQVVLRELDLEDGSALGMPSGAGIILVAEELTPSLVTRSHSHPVRGIVCARGGRFSHGAVLARSFAIPAVIGVENATDRVRHGEPVIVFGEEGRVLAGVDAEQQVQALTLAEERKEVRRAVAGLAREPGRTADGTRIEVLANLESPRDLELFDPEAAEGVGLFRTEFLFMERAEFPSEREQCEIYESVLQRFPGRPVVFRTLDVGGDKRLRYFRTPHESNPAMGWRGLRVSLQWRDLFLVQLRALAVARRSGDARVLLPMVSALEELREVQALVEQLYADSNGSLQRLPLGVMIEVPAAAMALRDLARECDFFSVGTNDLVQYLYAVDRDNPWVSELYQPYHPAHLRVLRAIARAGERLALPTSVCGEMAGHAAGTLFLAGAGFRSLSVAGPFVAEAKALLRTADIGALRQLAVRAAACATAREAQGLLEDAAAAHWKEMVRRSGR